MLDYGVASRGASALLQRCKAVMGAPWAPRLPVEFGLNLRAHETTCMVLGRALAIGRS